MPFITANPNEYLIVGHQGQIVNRGVAARAFLWPGTPYVLLSSTQQEAPFEMTQESRDGIPLRFKGIVVYASCRLWLRQPQPTSDRADGIGNQSWWSQGIPTGWFHAGGDLATSELPRWPLSRQDRHVHTAP
jgi:hypothetical protein